MHGLGSGSERGASQEGGRGRRWNRESHGESFDRYSRESKAFEESAGTRTSRRSNKETLTNAPEEEEKDT